jgi:hypothetical protein
MIVMTMVKVNSHLQSTYRFFSLVSIQPSQVAQQDFGPRKTRVPQSLPCACRTGLTFETWVLTRTNPGAPLPTRSGTGGAAVGLRAKREPLSSTTHKPGYSRTHLSRSGPEYHLRVTTTLLRSRPLHVTVMTAFSKQVKEVFCLPLLRGIRAASTLPQVGLLP